MDKLKKHIQENREQLDNKLPSDAVWANLEKRLGSSKAKIISIKNVRWVAAASVFVIAALVWFNRPTNNQNIQNSSAAVKPETTIQKAEQPTETNNLKEEIASENKLPSTIQEQKSLPKTNNTKAATATNNAEVENTLHSLQTSFVTIINLQRDKINTTPIYAEGPSYFKDFSLRFKQMDKDEKEIKKQIVANGLTDELLNQLINVYQQKINVLKLLQSEIGKTNSRYLQTKPDSVSTQTSFLKI